MEGIDLQSMPLDELWALHETICSILARKLEAEKRSLEQRLNKLRRTIGNASNETHERRPYPKVHPKFRNPKPPHQTWSGRGRQPRWVRELLAAGKTIDDLRFQRSPLRGRPPADEYIAIARRFQFRLSFFVLKIAPGPDRMEGHRH